MNVRRSAGVLARVLHDARLAWRLFRDRRVSIAAKAVPLLTAAYIIWPGDLLVDPMLGLGQMDDLAVFLMGLNLFIRLCPADLVRSYRRDHGRAVDVEGDVVDATYFVLDEQAQNGG
ncbi:MAG TPA: DUF1232 domain-containing protein [Chloroflexi bacterium]|jgi:uncharacterized membrane protein YkvA (DUF1232 family)|nr:DUF1232 domain-containing protein [Chloroflexota bacterium]